GEEHLDDLLDAIKRSLLSDLHVAYGIMDGELDDERLIGWLRDANECVVRLALRFVDYHFRRADHSKALSPGLRRAIADALSRPISVPNKIREGLTNL
ncbi:MAG: hypothetical protein ACYTFN_13155, partial [Planctomycetota bacterium]